MCVVGKELNKQCFMLVILVTITCYKALVVKEANFQGLKLCSLGNWWEFYHRVHQTHDFMPEVTP